MIEIPDGRIDPRRTENTRFSDLRIRRKWKKYKLSDQKWNPIPLLSISQHWIDLKEEPWERSSTCTATSAISSILENMRTTMDEAGIWKTVCLPILPHVTFDDLKEAQKQDDGVIPFTSFDPRKDYDLEAELSSDVARGAKGMKLHPIIQNEPLNSKRTFEAVEAFAPHGLPVLFHSGVAAYYLKKESYKENPENGDIHYAKDLIAAFPNVTFVVGHSGILQVAYVLEMLPDYKNAYVEISFQHPETIRQLISAFGPDRVLFGSDWPWVKRTTAIRAIKEACKGDKALEHVICYENSAGLLKL